MSMRVATHMTKVEQITVSPFGLVLIKHLLYGVHSIKFHTFIAIDLEAGTYAQGK